MRYTELVEDTTNNFSHFKITVDTDKLPKIYKIIEKANKQLKRHAKQQMADPITYSVSDPYTMTRKSKLIPDYQYDVTVSDMEINTTPPSSDGWLVVGSLDHSTTPPLIKKLTDYIDIPAHYRESTGSCEHCNSNRARKDTFIVYKNGEFKEIGRSCLKDFMGITHANVLSYLNTFDMMFKTIIDFKDDDYEPSERSSAFIDVLNTMEFLTYACAVIKKFGWVSAQQSRETVSISSYVATLNAMYPRDIDDEVQTTPEDLQKAKDIVAWGKNVLPNKHNMNDYEYNLMAILSSDKFRVKNSGLLASSVVAYDRYISSEKEKQQKIKNNKSTFQGKIGEKIQREVYVDKVTSYDGMYGVIGIHHMTDNDGNEYTWFCSGKKWLTQGDSYNITATVKKHETFNDIEQTVLTRVSIPKSK